MTAEERSPGDEAMEVAARDAPLILAVDDDPATLRMISLVLTTRNFRVLTAVDGESALRAASEQTPAAVLLGARLSAGLASLDVLTALKAKHGVPVLVISGDSDPALRIACIEHGANDFLDKPFAPDQLERHLRFLLRADEPPPGPGGALRVGDLIIDMQRQAVFRDGRMLPLNLTGWALFELLVSYDGEPVLYRELLTRALGRTYGENIGLLHACITRLRSKIDQPTTASKIVDFHGVGYALAYSPERPAGRGAA